MKKTRKVKLRSQPLPTTVRQGTASALEKLGELARLERHAVLATSDGDAPYASLIAFAPAPDEKSIFFATPRETAKYRNILKNPAVSVLIDTRTNKSSDYMHAEAVTVVGKAKVIRGGKIRAEALGALSKRHPRLRDFFLARTTRLIQVIPIRLIHVGRFQAVSEWSGVIL